MGIAIGIGNYAGNKGYGKSFDPSTLEYQAIWVANGKTNLDVDKNVPNLVDANNPLIPSNFSWNLNSGYQTISQDLNVFAINPERVTGSVSEMVIRITEILIPNMLMFYTRKLSNINSAQVIVEGLTGDMSLGYRYVENEVVKNLYIAKDGIYTLPSSVEVSGSLYTGFMASTYVGLCDITITELLEGDGLYLDGVDDTILSKLELPPLGKYTVVGDITFLEITSNGIYKSVSWSWYGGRIYLPGASYGISNVIGFNSENLIVSNNSSIPISPTAGDPIASRVGTRRAGADGNFPKQIFNSLAIIPSVLNEVGIRSVNSYLKTLKANNVG